MTVSKGTSSRLKEEWRGTTRPKNRLTHGGLKTAKEHNLGVDIVQFMQIYVYSKRLQLATRVSVVARQRTTKFLIEQDSVTL